VGAAGGRIGSVGAVGWPGHGTSVARVGRVGVATPVDRGGAGGQRRHDGVGWAVGCRGVGGADGREPAGAVVGPAHDDLGHQQRGRGPGQEGQGAERHRSAARLAHLVVGLDGGQGLGGRPGRSGGIATGPGDAERDPSAGEARPAPLEQHAVRSGDSQQVDVPVELAGAGHEGHAITSRRHGRPAPGWR
jgi:hypothetical protein